MNDTGESSHSLNRRFDKLAMPNIIAGLEAGGRLRIVHKIERAVLEGLPERHPCTRGCQTITIARARRLHREGVLAKDGPDTFRLAKFQLEA